ncbi:hypothetical protein DY000_02054206 [Brassica cretica]|uniref:Reverse transcriptase zinc-binding domain-containing protein n=1 Tax=Brassica cretica TaxID=69181 RepID=A0ABQ7AD80_BRACR|nr:hypothetical protein DY000_02054206 [Brassica cretica]
MKLKPLQVLAVVAALEFLIFTTSVKNWVKGEQLKTLKVRLQLFGRTGLAFDVVRMWLVYLSGQRPSVGDLEISQELALFLSSYCKMGVVIMDGGGLLGWEVKCCSFTPSLSSSLWVKWVRRFLLREYTFWDVKDTGLGSWVWRKLLRIRSMAKRFLRYEVNDGNTARFWTDIWHPRGRLIGVAGEVNTQRLGIRREARISEVLHHGLDLQPAW